MFFPFPVSTALYLNLSQFVCIQNLAKQPRLAWHSCAIQVDFKYLETLASASQMLEFLPGLCYHSWLHNLTLDFPSSYDLPLSLLLN